MLHVFIGSRIAAFLAGIACHLFIFRRGEWDTLTWKVILSTFSVYFGAITVLATVPLQGEPPFSVHRSVNVATTLGLLAVSGIFASMTLYRGLFHRLGAFPGPMLARFSNFYITYLSIKRSHLYEEVEQLHRHYGDFVRIGPSELSISDPEAVMAIHGPKSTCVKGPWYTINNPMISLQMIRSKPQHVHRRRIWDRGFSAKALRDYEPRVVDYAEQLLSHLAATEGKPVNVTDWFNFYSFDVMGDLAWGKSFGMLRGGVKHYFMNSLHEFMATVGAFGHLVWLLDVLKGIPILNRDQKSFWAWIQSQVTGRKSMSPDRPDVFSWLLEDHNSKKPTFQDELLLTGDAALIAVAGSDTTAASLTCLFYELCCRPEIITRLQGEIDQVYAGPDTVDSVSLSKLPLLNAVINETLRLHPPVPSGVQRVTPPEGLQIGKHFIPGNTIVQVPTHTMCRDERNFASPNDFIPERWTTNPELVKNSSAFVPFSVGRYSCIGKHLGLMELRHVVSSILRKYTVDFAPGMAEKTFLDGKQDNFTLALAPLMIVFSTRS
ncbi:unnamed protein product [Clonostachys rosea]|uniref:Cytochrome P450 n=1 Tax=Bionectria ochroleuca TaxID=29856 RepID=A0ABY6UG46_BIOOC|nr:unnamed protein product [Clonostachys rosea]